jgi:hypothetical protein
MKLDVHIKNLSTKLGKSYYMMQSLIRFNMCRCLKKYVFCKLPFTFSSMAYFFEVMGKVKQFLTLQKKVIRLTGNVRRVTSCKELFKTLNTLPAPCMYIMETAHYSK